MTQAKMDQLEQAISWPSELDRIFRAIAFDWDGTAVPDRQSSAHGLVDAMERTLRDQVLLVIVTGTKLEHLDKQVIQFLTPSAKRFLYVCTNRGSEVFGFDKTGAATLKFRRESTVAEKMALDHAANQFQAYLMSTYGVESQIVANRLNRRKVDLIPVSRWSDPKKAEFPALLRAVEDRLRQARVFGGLQALLNKATEMATEAGISDPRVTSDIKHIEIGLTDKSDSIAWIKRNLLDAYQLPLSDVAIAGDEFGPIGALSGSDSLMRTPETRGAVYFSVGAEPAGPGQGVYDLKGGPETFVAFLDHQMRLRRSKDTKLPPLWKHQAPTPDEVWCVEQEGFDPSREREMETIFTIGNGYLGVRGALDTPIPSSQADLYVAGVYDRKISDLPYSELEFLTRCRNSYPYSELISLPTPFRFHLTLNGKPLNLVESTWNKHTRTLDLRQGLYFEHYAFEASPGKNIVINTIRCASAVDNHLLLQELEILSDDVRGTLEVDFSLLDSKLELHHPHLRQKRHEADTNGSEALCYRTHASRIDVAIASRLASSEGDFRSPKSVVALEPGKRSRIRRFLSVFTSRETPRPYEKARKLLGSMDWSEFDDHLFNHVSNWESTWDTVDIKFSKSAAQTEATRFNSYHLLIAAPTDPRISIGARTLSGRGYEGHIFWDTEIFMLPFFLHTFPEKAKTLLLYRHHTLDGARRRAKQMGHPGACFAWESTITGDDVTPDHIILKTSQKEIPIFTGEHQIHVTADVAYGISRYWQSTQDHEFMLEFGVEILIETARFWASRCKLRGNRFHILNVVGPDEYHHGVNDNAFTNWMVKHHLSQSLFFVDWMRGKDPIKWSELSSKLGFKDRELRDWQFVHDYLFIPIPNDDGIIEQFEGFFDLEEYPLSSEERLKAPIDRLFDWKEINRQKLVKQADVLMLPFLFPDRFSMRELKSNFYYYEPRTDHGSSLSPSVHATIAAWIGEHEAARRYFRQSLELDLFNIMKNTALGIHAACIGGTWQALVYGFLGVRTDGETLKVNEAAASRILDDWGSVALTLRHRHQIIGISVGKEKIR